MGRKKKYSRQAMGRKQEWERKKKAYEKDTDKLEVPKKRETGTKGRIRNEPNMQWGGSERKNMMKIEILTKQKSRRKGIQVLQKGIKVLIREDTSEPKRQEESKRKKNGKRKTNDRNKDRGTKRREKKKQRKEI